MNSKRRELNTLSLDTMQEGPFTVGPFPRKESKVERLCAGKRDEIEMQKLLKGVIETFAC
jgi:hypothetical protein